ncbi:hypothetical protein PC129_g6144 [Phytophthora cactorum]|uniref:Uncharacterized protein n=1 Tax=Phytophthora cactorum TaxID=29920 RepID=A0A329RE37_9STRA|nr:hypothetical protein Pcac1_g6909 [Phytophthora cactorum]KAG2822837.1 hypothetical protein PC111_g10482 [Phytophthora cactorum]KAG2829252.1 hypothetical protein PC112_g8171 [Phytophthora cactorum]KAG2859990.1 hypothetical protein PC113_g8441 [Phytophthora cactorum]KAG2913047.1 hypothetical protein PC114_g8671 [Phytophthora cactorum]
MENISIGEFIGEYTGKLTMDNFNKASVQTEYAMEKAKPAAENTMTQQMMSLEVQTQSLLLQQQQ